MASDSSAQKLGNVLNPMLDIHTNSTKQYIDVKGAEIIDVVNANFQQMMLHMISLEQKIATIEGVAPEKKKAVKVVEKKPPTAVVADQGVVLEKKVPINKMVYFRENFKISEEFRKRYVTPEMAKLMEADPTVTSKTTEIQKRASEATFCWKYIKDNKTPSYDLIEKEFQALKTNSIGVNKPQQEQAEANTP